MNPTIMAEVLLRRGTQDTHAVQTLQQLLNKAGAYPVLSINGDFDEQTEIAVRHFQWVHQLPASGHVDPYTWKALQSTQKVIPLTPSQRPILTYNASGGPVYELQARLNAVGTQPPLEITGHFDGKTFKAVQHFQWRSNLTVHGTVDAATWSHLLGWAMPTSESEPFTRSSIDGDNLSLLTIAQMGSEEWEKLQASPLASISVDSPSRSTLEGSESSSSNSGSFPTPPPLSTLRLNFPQWRGPRTPKGRPYLMAEFREPSDSLEGPIHELQRLLKAQGFTTIPTNGYFNRIVFEAVKTFQAQHNLITIDGRVGDEVWDRLLDRKPEQRCLQPLNAPRTTPSLAHLCQYYDSKNSPHQTAALLWLQSQIPIETYNAFVAYWRNPN